MTDTGRTLSWLRVASRNQRRLLFTPEPLSGESNYGYLRRVWDANRLTNVAAASRIIAVAPRTIIFRGTGYVHALLSGRLASAAPGFEAICKDNKAKKWSQAPCAESRVCPACLQEAAYWRAAWDLPLTLHCRRHGIILCDECSACHVAISHVRCRSLLQCRCGFDFRLGDAQSAPAWLSVYEAVFRPWLSSDGSETYSDRIEASERKAAYLLDFLICEASTHNGLNGRPRRTRNCRIRPRDLPILTKLIEPWPKNMSAMVGSAAMSMTASERHKFAYRVRQAALPLVSAALKDYFVHSERCRRQRAGKQRREPPPQGFVSLQTYRKLVGLNSGVVISMFSSGQLTGSAMSIAKRDRWIAEEELQVGLAIRRNAPTLFEAAKFLNCRARLLIAMNAHRLLPAVVDPRLPRVLRFRQRDLVHLLDGLRSRTTDQCEAGDEFVSIAQIVPYTPYCAPNWFHLFERIRCRQVAVFHVGKPDLALANFAIRRSDGSSFLKRFAARKCRG